MAKARVKFGLTAKFAMALDTWAGKECTHIQVVETIDEQGNVIDRTETSTTIYALIGNPGTSTNNQPPGVFQTGDLCGYFKVADGVQAFSQLTASTIRQDRITHEGTTYRLELTDTIWDVDEESIRVFRMKKIAP